MALHPRYSCKMAIRWKEYPTQGLHDELMRGGGRPREAARFLCQHLKRLSEDEIHARKAAAILHEALAVTPA